MTIAEEAAKTLRELFAAARIECPKIEVSEIDYIGDGLCGCVNVEGLTMYPVQTDRGIGWGVDEAVTFPGCHTMPNGDPGYPDEVDVRTIVPATKTRQSILGDIATPHFLGWACHDVVNAVVAWRISEWNESQADIDCSVKLARHLSSDQTKNHRDEPQTSG
jgi:hypothetical protein